MRALVSLLFLLFLASSSFAQFPVELRLVPPAALEQGNQTTWKVIATNRTEAPIERLRVRFSAGEAVVSMPEGCVFDNSSAECDIALPAYGRRELIFVTRAFPGSCRTGATSRWRTPRGRVWWRSTRR